MTKKFITIAAVGIIAIFALSGCLRSRGPKAGAVSLSIYGLDDADTFSGVIEKFKAVRPNVKVKYKKIEATGAFEDLLVNEIAEGEGPDIFYVHNTWFPRHLKKVVPLVAESFTPENFTETYIKVAAEDFIQPDPKDGLRKIYALPLYADTLALYYNKTIFEQKIPERGKPASTWAVFEEDISKLRTQKEDSTLEHGGIALGRADNIRLAADILYHLFLQYEAAFYDDEAKQVRIGTTGSKAFEFFLSFSQKINKQYSWSKELAGEKAPLGELEAFLSGRVSSIFGYSDLLPRLENELKNVKARNASVLDKKEIGVAPSPQISDDETAARVLANYYGLAVSRNSKNPQAAWDFIRFASGKDYAEQYLKKTKRPTARRDLIESQRKEPLLDVFVSQLGKAGSFRIFSDQKFAEYLREAVTSANNGQTPREALSAAQDKMNAILEIEAPDGLYPKPPVVKKK